MVDFNMDVGELFKKLFSKKKEGEEKTPTTNTSEKIKSKTSLLIAGSIGVVLLIFLLHMLSLFL